LCRTKKLPKPMKNITHGYYKIKNTKNMNKIFVTLLLLFIASANLQAQKAQKAKKTKQEQEVQKEKEAKEKQEEAQKEKEEKEKQEEAQKAKEEKEKQEEAQKAKEEKEKQEEAQKAKEEKEKQEAAQKAKEEKEKQEAAQKAKEAKEKQEAAQKTKEAKEKQEAAQKAEEAKGAEQKAEEAKGATQKAKETQEATQKAKEAQEAEQKAKEEREALERWRYYAYTLIALAAGAMGFGGWWFYNSRKKGDTQKGQGGSQSHSPKPTNSGSRNELFDRLEQMENAFTREIQKLSNNQGEVQRLQGEREKLKAKLEGVENEKSALKLDLQKANADKNKAQSETEELKKRIIAVDFLKDYSGNVFSYLEFCQQVSNEAYNFFERVSRQNPREAFAAGLLLIKFQNAVNSIPVGDWRRTLQDIKDTGATANRQLHRSFSQIQNNPDKQKEFQRLLFSEVLVKYSSDILILAEAFKNLSRFRVPADFASEAQRAFGKYVTEIVNKAKSTGLTIKHIPLFENWERYAAQVKDNGGERSPAYKEITGLEKGAIAEIVSYGVTTSLGEDTKTIILQA